MPSLFRPLVTFGFTARTTRTPFLETKWALTSSSPMNLQSTVLLRPMRTHQSVASDIKDGPTSFMQHVSVFTRIAAAAYVFQVYIANCTLSIGPSMQPTLNDKGDMVLTEAITPRLKRLEKGDIVVATKPTDPRVAILKRIQGMPGDTVRVNKQGTGHGDIGDGTEEVDVVVPLDHVWLQGDNQQQSTDSRYYGAVPMSLIRAKVWCRIWPIGQFVWFDRGLECERHSEFNTSVMKSEDRNDTKTSRCK